MTDDQQALKESDGRDQAYQIFQEEVARWYQCFGLMDWHVACFKDQRDAPASSQPGQSLYLSLRDNFNDSTPASDVARSAFQTLISQVFFEGDEYKGAHVNRLTQVVWFPDWSARAAQAERQAQERLKAEEALLREADRAKKMPDDFVEPLPEDHPLNVLQGVDPAKEAPETTTAVALDIVDPLPENIADKVREIERRVVEEGQPKGPHQRLVEEALTATRELLVELQEANLELQEANATLLAELDVVRRDLEQIRDELGGADTDPEDPPTPFGSCDTCTLKDNPPRPDTPCAQDINHTGGCGEWKGPKTCGDCETFGHASPGCCLVGADHEICGEFIPRTSEHDPAKDTLVPKIKKAFDAMPEADKGMPNTLVIDRGLYQLAIWGMERDSELSAQFAKGHQGDATKGPAVFRLPGSAGAFPMDIVLEEDVPEVVRVLYREPQSEIVGPVETSPTPSDMAPSFAPAYRGAGCVWHIAYDSRWIENLAQGCFEMDATVGESPTVVAVDQDTWHAMYSDIDKDGTNAWLDDQFVLSMRVEKQGGPHWHLLVEIHPCCEGIIILMYRTPEHLVAYGEALAREQGSVEENEKPESGRNEIPINTSCWGCPATDLQYDIEGAIALFRETHGKPPAALHFTSSDWRMLFDHAQVGEWFRSTVDAANGRLVDQTWLSSVLGLPVCVGETATCVVGPVETVKETP